MTEQEGPRNWQHTIWRSWRHTDDDECARQLYSLVADERGGLGVTISAVALAAVYGAAMAALVALLVPTLGGTLPALPALLMGAVVGGLVGLPLGLRMTWRQWLERLSPAAPVPGQENAGGTLALLGRLTRGQHPTRVQATEGSTWRFLGICQFLFLLLLVLAMAGASVSLPIGLAIGIGLGIQIGLVGGFAGVLAIVPPALIVVGVFAGLPLALEHFTWALVEILRWGLHGLAGGMGGMALGVMTTGLVALLVPRPYAWEWRGLWSWWRGRPVPAELEQALAEAGRKSRAAEAVWDPLLRGIAGQLRQPPPFEELLRGLTSHHWGERFICYHVLVGLGGGVVESLRQQARAYASPLQEEAFDLLVDIVRDTQGRLGELAPLLLCKRCLVRCAPVRVSLPGPDLFYYGCRSCGQSRDFLAWPGEVVAVLDQRMKTASVRRDNVMWVNWLQRRAPFDFVRVEIGRASDEEAEGLAVALGNDTDPERRERYGGMRCHVAPGSGLTENTLRVLQRIFGQVVVRS